MNTRQIGNRLEKFVAELLKVVDPKSRPTVGSGACKEISDLMNRRFYVECKHRNTKDITLKEKVWNKLCAEIPIGSLKTPLYILRNQNNKAWVVLDIKDFIEILKQIKGE